MSENGFNKLSLGDRSSQHYSGVLEQGINTGMTVDSWMKVTPHPRGDSEVPSSTKPNESSFQRNDRYFVPQQARNPFLSGDPRSAGKNISKGPQTCSGLGVDPKAQNNKNLELSGYPYVFDVPHTSRASANNWRQPLSKDFKDDCSSPIEREGQIRSTTFSLQKHEAPRKLTRGISKPGGDLVNIRKTSLSLNHQLTGKTQNKSENALRENPNLCQLQQEQN
jgi:hypothetical protein